MASGRHRERQGSRPTATQSEGKEFGRGSDRHHALTIAIACYGRCTQAAQEERETAASIGGSGSRCSPGAAVPPAVYEYTTCDETERSGWSRAEERRSPFVLPVPGEHMPLPVLSRRACAVPAASVPRVRARVCVRTFGDTWTTTFFALNTPTRHGIHAPSHAGLTPEKTLHPDATARAHEDTDCLPHRP
jgi:hypothetical protein